MDARTQEAVIKLIRERAPEFLSVTWYGGEPLLALDVSQSLSERISKVATDIGAKVGGSTIITNGYLLSSSTAQLLRELGVKRAQVTLDGPRAVHDSRRCLRNGAPTFDTIIDNIKGACEYLDISIRTNVDTRNESEACSLVDLLISEGLLPDKITFHMAGVGSSDNGVCSDVCLSSFEINSFMLGFAADRHLDLGMRRSMMRRVALQHVMSG